MSGGNKKGWHSWFIPTPTDGFIFILSLLVLSVIFAITGAAVQSGELFQLEPFFFPLAGCWLAIAGVIGAKRWARFSSAVFWLLMAAGSMALFGWLALLTGTMANADLLTAYDLSRWISIEHLGWIAGLFVATIIISFILSRTIGKSGGGLLKIGVAGVLILVGFSVMNMFRDSPADFLVGDRFDKNTVFGIATVLLAIFAGAIPAVLFQRKKSVLAFAFGFVYLAALGFAVWTLSQDMFDRQILANLFFTFAAMFGLIQILFALTGPDSPGAEATTEEPVVDKAGTSIWGWVLGGLSVASLILFVNYDPTMLYSWPSDDKLEMAKFSRQLQRQPGVQTIVSTGDHALRSEDFFEIRSVMGEQTPVTFLAPLGELNVLLRLQLFGFDTDMETIHVRNHEKYVELANGEVSAIQVNDFAQNSLMLAFENMEFDFADDDELDISLVPSLVFSQMKQGEMTKFLQRMSHLSYFNIININDCDLSEGDWNEIFKMGSHYSFSVKGVELTPEIAKIAEKYGPQPKLTITSSESHPELTSDDWKVLLDTGIRMARSKSTNKVFWDALFAGLGRSWFDVDHEMFSNRIDWDDFESSATESNLVYGFDESGKEARKLFLPFVDKPAVGVVAKLENLEALSFDYRWIGGTRFERGLVMFDDYKELSALTNLKELYLTRESRGSDMAFLKDLKKLEHLQVHCDAQNVNEETCPNLKSITLISSRNLFAVWPRLEKIESLELVRIFDTQRDYLDSEANVESLKKKFDGRVKIEILDPQDAKVSLPDDFRDHIDGIRDRARKMYVKNGEAAAKL